MLTYRYEYEKFIRQRDRKADKHRDRQLFRQGDRQKDVVLVKWRERQGDRQYDGQLVRQRETDRQTDRRMANQSVKQICINADVRRISKKDRQTDRHT